MQPFMDIRGLTPQPGRLKCVWVRGANGRLESIWVPDWEREGEVPVEKTTKPLRKAS